MKTIQGVLWLCLMSVIGCSGDNALDGDAIESESSSISDMEPAMFRDGIELYPQMGTSIDHDQLAARDGYATSMIDHEGKSWEVMVASGVSDMNFSESGFKKSPKYGPVFYHKTTEQFADFEPDCVVYIDAGRGLYAALRRSIHQGACPKTKQLSTWLPNVIAKEDGDGLASKKSALSFGAYTGTFNGVNSYSNYYPQYYCPDFKPYGQCTSYFGDQLAGIKWQCVEYADRYYLAAYNHTNLWKGHAKYWYSKAAQYGLKSYPNCGTTAPKVGDMLVSTYGSYGHIAIVRSVGLLSVTVIQQNWFENEKDNHHVIPMVNVNGKFCVSGFGGSSYPVAGWIRK